ncbi:MAG: MFS transporter [Chloroflexota bacterium]|nr:MFS transporter [Chloroflexota bacterium]
MFFRKLSNRIRDVYTEYPGQFWVLVLGMFIDTLGRTILNPFLMLYVTKRFEVGMTEVGLLFGLMSVANTVGRVLGGALTDRLGRKWMMILGLFVSGLSSLAMGMVGTFGLFFGVLLFVGLVASIGGPAQGAMVADLLPEEKRAGGFGIFRVVTNMAWICGPVIGGFMATRSYMPLFICDAVASTITAGILLVAIQETKPAPREGEPEQTVSQTFAGYWNVLQDVTFVLFIGACILMTVAYIQLYTTLGIYLRDTHGLPEQAYGYLMSLNATAVVLLQVPIARRIARYQPMLMMALGTFLYAIGFGMYGFFSSYVLFIVAMFVITVGEMVVMPTSQALVAKIAPEDMRGRYMAVFGFGWAIPQAVGPLLAGLIMDNADPRWVWYGAGLVGLVGAVAFILLRRRTEQVAEKVSRVTEVVTPA